MAATKPTSVRIGHRIYTIEWVPEAEWLRQEPEDKLGVYWYEVGTIRLRNAQNGRQVHRDAHREILLHEILHGCFAHANMERHGALDKDQLEEWIVSSLSFPLIQVLTDNPQVAAYISGK